MKLNDIQPNIETSGELEEQFFSIQDQGMIFDILRNKMYSNPILAICREISCNARDAHREVGTPEVPIQIYLPTSLEPFYKIKDFGPGISPDRMSNIFIKYTASTKRSDNIQTGGFGLGAKTPFSYSDTFTIITNYNGVQYNYACFIDETKVGKLALFSSSPTKEPNGTEIIIPVKPPDFRHFAEWTEHATKHWDVKPIIKGGSITYDKINKVIEGNKWAIAQSPNSWQRELKLIIDGIEYPAELSALKTYADSKMIDCARGNIYLYFDVGELSLSASREQVYLDKMTQEKIRFRLDEMALEVKQRIVSKIESFNDYWTANIYYRHELNNAFSNISFLGKLSWHGNPLFESAYLSLGCPVFIFTKGKYSRRYGTDPNKISRSNGNQSLHFDENAILFVNDLPLKEPTGRHLKKVFDDDPNVKTVFVVCPNDTVTQTKLNTDFHFDLMKPRNLSEVTKASGRSYTQSSGTRLIIFKLTSDYQFKQSSHAALDEDMNEKVLCKLVKDSYGNNRQPILNNKKVFNTTCFRTLMKKFPHVSFYGVDSLTPEDKLEDDFSDFIDLDDFINTKVLKDSGINFVEIAFARHNTYKVDDRQIKHIDRFASLITNHNSIFMKRLNLHDKIRKLGDVDYGLLDIYETINERIPENELEQFAKDHPDMDIELINSEYDTKYPLIKHLNIYRLSEIIKDLAQYINFADTI
jgi:hypothetical protein